MKQTLGRLLFLLLTLSTVTFASVKASLSNPAVYEGDMVTLTITADGSDILFPKIDNIAGNPVQGTSSSQSISVINGVTTRTLSKSYTFRATKTIEIPSYEVKVDAKVEKTAPLTLKVVKPTASQNGSDFVVEIALDKNESYVGEPLNLSLSFKSKLNAHADQVQLGEPKLEHFWVKKRDDVSKKSEGEYVVQIIHYLLFPQKAGTYEIPAIEAMIGKVAQRQSRGGFFDDPFFNRLTQELRWQKIYSNSLKIKIKPLPNGLEVFGNYEMEASVDKQKVHANKPVNLTLTIKGEGNIDDIQKFDLDIDNVIVYADEPKITASEIHGIYQGEFKQKIALIADANFTIPSLSLSYFDKLTQKVKTIKSKPIDIEVIGGTTQATSKASTIEVGKTAETPQVLEAPQNKAISTKVVTKTEDSYVKYLFLTLGFVLGASSILVLNYVRKKEPKKESDMIKAIRKAKDDQALFSLLLPHSKKHKVISEVLNQLEENLYRGGSNVIDKERVMEVFEEEDFE